jgi:hypothetical protein
VDCSPNRDPRYERAHSLVRCWTVRQTEIQDMSAVIERIRAICNFLFFGFCFVGLDLLPLEMSIV